MLVVKVFYQNAIRVNYRIGNIDILLRTFPMAGKFFPTGKFGLNIKKKKFLTKQEFESE